MKKVLVFGCIFLSWILAAQAAEDEFDLNEVRLSHGLRMLPEKEITFVAGPDGEWFTADDAVYLCYLAEYTPTGKMTRKSSFNAGKDKTPFTADDTLKEYWEYTFDTKGKPAHETYYKVNAEGATSEEYRGSYQCNPLGQKLKAIRYKGQDIIRYITCDYGPRGHMTGDVEYVGPGPDGKWFTSDDEIEKYHRREFDVQGKLVRVREYHSKHQGQGPDNLWFTADDVVSSTKVFIYSDTGLVARINKYIDKGIDNRWFTDDDLLQYYTLMQYSAKK